MADLESILSRTVGRSDSLFREDLDANESAIRERVEGKRILVTGVLNDSSIAFTVARRAQEEGAESDRDTRPDDPRSVPRSAPRRGRCRPLRGAGG